MAQVARTSSRKPSWNTQVGLNPTLHAEASPGAALVNWPHNYFCFQLPDWQGEHGVCSSVPEVFRASGLAEGFALHLCGSLKGSVRVVLCFGVFQGVGF